MALDETGILQDLDVMAHRRAREVCHLRDLTDPHPLAMLPIGGDLQHFHRDVEPSLVTQSDQDVLGLGELIQELVDLVLSHVDWFKFLNQS
jgi:hypothetical protein